MSSSTQREEGVESVGRGSEHDEMDLVPRLQDGSKCGQKGLATPSEGCHVYFTRNGQITHRASSQPRWQGHLNEVHLAAP
jgi:hypothetical protein